MQTPSSNVYAPSIGVTMAPHTRFLTVPSALAQPAGHGPIQLRPDRLRRAPCCSPSAFMSARRASSQRHSSLEHLLPIRLLQGLKGSVHTGVKERESVIRIDRDEVERQPNRRRQRSGRRAGVIRLPVRNGGPPRRACRVLVQSMDPEGLRMNTGATSTLKSRWSDARRSSPAAPNGRPRSRRRAVRGKADDRARTRGGVPLRPICELWFNVMARQPVTANSAQLDHFPAASGVPGRLGRSAVALRGTRSSPGARRPTTAFATIWANNSRVSPGGSQASL